MNPSPNPSERKPYPQPKRRERIGDIGIVSVTSVKANAGPPRKLPEGKSPGVRMLWDDLAQKRRP